MDIIVSTPGSPGTSFTDNVKDIILTIYRVLNNNPDFSSVREMGKELEKEYKINWNYTRNILPFLQNCGIVDYQSGIINNESVFTNLGKAFIDVLESKEIAKKEPDCDEKTHIMDSLEKVENYILFQCLVMVMKAKDCNYSRDFFDVLQFAYEYGSIDSKEYLLIQYMRENETGNYIKSMKQYVEQYRNNELEINVKTQTKNGLSDESKSVNSFPYVHGNFGKAGIMIKTDDGRYRIVEDRISEVEEALNEVGKVWMNSAE